MTDTIDKRIKPDKAYKEYLKLISKYTHKRQKGQINIHYTFTFFVLIDKILACG